MPSLSISFHHSLELYDIHLHYFYFHLFSTQLTGLDTPNNSNSGIIFTHLSPIPWSPSPIPPPQRNYPPWPTSIKPSGTPTPGPTRPIPGPTPELSERGSRNQRRERDRRSRITSCSKRAGARQQAPNKYQHDKSSSQPWRKGRNRNMILQKKLYFIQKCYEQAKEYKSQNKFAF